MHRRAQEVAVRERHGAKNKRHGRAGRQATRGLDRAIKNFVKKDNFVLSGFSAGALVLTPNIKVCNLDKYDANKVGIEDYAAIGIVDFEVFPHYTEEDWRIFTDYSKSTENTVRRMTDDEYIVVNS